MIALIGLLQWAKLDPLAAGAWRVNWKVYSEKMRVYATLGNPNWVAGFLAGSLPLAIAAVILSKGRFAKAACVVAAFLILACIVATRSLGGYAPRGFGCALSGA